jgi:hypothetical protein
MSFGIRLVTIVCLVTVIIGCQGTNDDMSALKINSRFSTVR